MENPIPSSPVPPPPPTSPSDFEKNGRTWAMLCHLTALAGMIIPFGNIFGPLIIWLIKKNEFPVVDEQGKEALNFNISVTIYLLVSLVLIIVCIGYLLLIGIGIAALVFTIIAAVKASNGEQFRYPLTIRFIK